MCFDVLCCVYSFGLFRSGLVFLFFLFVGWSVGCVAGPHVCFLEVEALRDIFFEIDQDESQAATGQKKRRFGQAIEVKRV